MRNAEYWRERFKALEDRQYRKTEEYIKDVERQFRTAQNNIQADIEKWYYRLAENNDISYYAAKKLLSKNELEEFHWTVEQYIKYGEENAINQKWMKQLENASAKVHINRLEAMKIQMQQESEKLFQEYHGGVTDFLGRSYADRYCHTAYEVAKGTGVGHSLASIDRRRIEIVLNHPWAQDGKVFSDRVWENKEKLVSTLHTELSQCIIRGEDPYRVVETASKKLQVSRNRAARGADGKTYYVPADMKYREWEERYVKNKGGPDLTQPQNDSNMAMEGEDMPSEYQRYGRNKGTQINNTYINSGEYRKKFDGITDNSSINRLLLLLPVYSDV